MRAEIIASAQWKSAAEFENLRRAVVDELSYAGVEIFCTNTAGSNAEKLNDLLRLALSRSDAVIICAPTGIGEKNDTVASISSALGLETVENGEVSAKIKEHFAKKEEEPQESDLAMAKFPVGAVVFENGESLCAGCAIRSSDQCILVLPQDIRELVPMLRNHVVPYLSALSSTAVCTETVRIFYYGASCEGVRAEIEKLCLSGVKTELTESFGEVRVHITAKAADRRGAAMLARMSADKIRARFGKDALRPEHSSLEEDTVELLKYYGMTVATAESCTAGLISKRITDVPGASRVFGLGAATYATEKKHELLGVSDEIIEKYGVVSSEVAAAMALGARKLSGSDLAVAVTGYAGPESDPGKPVGLVYIALCDGGQVWIRRLQLGAENDREYIRNTAASHAINLVRSYLYALPNKLEGGEPCFAREPQQLAVAADEPRKASAKPRNTASTFISRIIFIVALLTMLGSGAYLIYNLVVLPYFTQQKVQGVADMVVTQDDENSEQEIPKYTEDGMLTKYASVKAENADFVGWIKIPNTKIDYPVMQSGKDIPERYLHRDFYGNYDANGSIFAYYDCRLEKDSLSKNTVLFGHHMRSGMMFQNLMYYDVYQKSGPSKAPDYDSNLDFYKANPLITFDTVYEEGEWVIFAVLKLNTLYAHGDPFDFIRSDFADDEAFEQFISDIRIRSIIDTNGCIDVNKDDYLLTLQTCSYEYSDFRTVIVARKVRDGEIIDVSSATIAENPLMPDIWGKE